MLLYSVLGTLVHLQLTGLPTSFSLSDLATNTIRTNFSPLHIGFFFLLELLALVKIVSWIYFFLLICHILIRSFLLIPAYSLTRRHLFFHSSFQPLQYQTTAENPGTLEQTQSQTDDRFSVILSIFLQLSYFDLNLPGSAIGKQNKAAPIISVL